MLDSHNIPVQFYGEVEISLICEEESWRHAVRKSIFPELYESSCHLCEDRVGKDFYANGAVKGLSD